MNAPMSQADVIRFISSQGSDSVVTQSVFAIAAGLAATRVLPAARGQRNLLLIKNTGANPFGWRFNNFPTGDGGDYVQAAGELMRFDYAVPQSAWNVISVGGLATTVMILEGIHMNPNQHEATTGGGG